MNRLFLFCCLCLAGTFAVAQNGKVGIGTTTPQAQLHTTGSVRLDTLKGTGTRLVYTNDSGLLYTPPVTFGNANSINIPDKNCAGVSSTITVNNMAIPVPSGNIRVRIDITHTADGDLLIYLISPTGDTLNLAYGNGGIGDNYTNTIFWDSAAQSLSTANAPFTGIYKPTGRTSFNPLSCADALGTISTFNEFGGGTVVPNGTWTLKVIDRDMDRTVNGVGILNNWSISFNNTNPPLVNGFSFESNYIPKGTITGTLTNSSIYDNGNVGIGTSLPTQKLDVAGAVKATGFIGDGSTLTNVVNTNSAQTISGIKTFAAPLLVNRIAAGGITVPLADLDLFGDTLGMRATNGWDNLWFNVDGATANINASGAESGLNFKVGNNSTGTYGNGQTLTIAMTLLPSGSVGIGTTTPGHKLDVVGGTALQTMRLSGGRGRTNNDGILVIQDSSNNSAGGNNNELIEFLNASGVFIGSISRVGGTNSIAFNNPSDIRLKTDIRPTHYGLNDLMAIEVADYQYKGAGKAALQTGFLAQQLYKVYPIAVTKGNDADEKQPYMVDYSKLTPLLVKAVQELKTQVDALRQENQALQADNKRIAELSEQMKELRQMVNTTATQAKR